ncbi:MAG TPA: zinc dependent phospholipase C family protein [Anaerolineales bacterium]|nr:zinc dependent phospholipase C family protein [Anaerolineales bacterium]
MNPYSHLILAKRVEDLLQPVDLQDYYWGAIVPDIRYLAGMERRKTHFKKEKCVQLMAQFPKLESFLQGYLVHCLADRISIQKLFQSTFPFSVVRNRLHRKQIAVLLELFYVKGNTFTPKITASYNQVLRNLGLQEEDCIRYSEFINQYVGSESLEQKISSFAQMLSLTNNPNIDRYISAANWIENNPLLQNLLVLGIRAGRINEKIETSLVALLNESAN